MPGYGKTAAIRQWIETVDVPVAWVSLDMLDQELESFWSNVLMALDTAAPGIAEEPTLLLHERGARDHLFLGALVAALVERETPVLLVLDGLDGNLDRHGARRPRAARRASGRAAAHRRDHAVRSARCPSPAGAPSAG